MTPRIVAALVTKEALRYWHNRPALVLAMLLVLVSLLVSVGHTGGRLDRPQADRPGVCYVLYNHEDGFVRHLKSHRPPGLEVYIAPVSDYAGPDSTILYPSAGADTPTVSIQIRPGDWTPPQDSGFDPVTVLSTPSKYKIWYWYPPDRADALLPFREWFHAQLRAFHANEPTIVEAHSPFPSPAGAILPIHRVVTALVAAAVYLLCFHLNIVVTSEERERRTLLAQMLSPMTVVDVLVAKVCFYVPATLALAAIVLGTNFPDALTHPYFWIAMVSACVGYLSIGLIICSLTRSQSAAGLAALTYFVLIGVIVYLSSIMPVFSVLKGLLLDYYLMQSIHNHLVGTPPWWVPLQTAALVILATLWAFIAAAVFARRGWR